MTHSGNNDHMFPGHPGCTSYKTAVHVTELAKMDWPEAVAAAAVGQPPGITAVPAQQSQHEELQSRSSAGLAWVLVALGAVSVETSMIELDLPTFNFLCRSVSRLAQTFIFSNKTSSVVAGSSRYGRSSVLIASLRRPVRSVCRNISRTNCGSYQSFDSTSWLANSTFCRMLNARSRKACGDSFAAWASCDNCLNNSVASRSW